ncbi:hypothetical protein R3P38DRAFT_2872349 [Favolaschia claudopus]|uniref:Uncharacterized protein n=1 Tax=Favolaschia claudopus TaxID=2862362 RepID=A0AAW0DE85_9AGAR
MHEALDLKIVSNLPDKPANRSLPDSRVATNTLSNYTSKFCIGTSPICVLSVLYVNLDPRMIPTPQAMELMIHHATRPSYIDAARLSLKALHHFTDLRIYQETVDACPDLWARVWPWMRFFDTSQGIHMSLAEPRNQNTNTVYSRPSDKSITVSYWSEWR